MDVKNVVERCSKYSGLRLEARIEVRKGVRYLTIGDPSSGRYDLTLSVGVGGRCLREVYGRMHHWKITTAEQDVLLRFLNSPEVAVEKPALQMCNPFDIDSLACK